MDNSINIIPLEELNFKIRAVHQIGIVSNSN